MAWRLSRTARAEGINEFGELHLSWAACRGDFLKVLLPGLPAALEMHGDALGVRQDVFLDGNGDAGSG